MTYKTINLNQEEADLLERFCEQDLDAEFEYQMSQEERDTDHYIFVLSLYKKLLGRPKNFVNLFVTKDILKERYKQLQLLKEKEEK